MTRRLALSLAAVVALLGVAGRAEAATGSSLTEVRSYDVPLRAERSLATASPGAAFDLIGVHWRGTGRVEVSVRTGRDSWGPWLALDDDASPDLTAAEARTRRGWRIGEGLWVGRATRFRLRALGSVTRARVWTVRSKTSRVPTRVTSAAGKPAYVSRAQWLADESLRRAEADVAPALRFAVVHHTAGPNTYTREEAPAVVRAIMAYHVQSNGWNDIGYNALVDRFGTVYEGRHGGLDRNVVGAHARGFNTGSFGIAVLGELTSIEPSKPAFEALARTLAWRLDLAHVDPLATVEATAAGNERFTAGAAVPLRAISGHRDTGLTACPGNRLYARLPALAQRVAGTGLPKIYDPAVSGEWGGLQTLTARLSASAPWKVTLTAADGSLEAEQSGSAVVVEATWDTATLAAGEYTWRIEAPGATPATGSVGASDASVALALADVSAREAVISPNADGVLDSTTIGYRLSVPATVSAVAVDPAGVAVATLAPARWRRAGAHELAVDGAGLSDGAYTIRLEARSATGESVTTDVGLAITRTLERPSLASALFTPNGDGRGDRLGIGFRLTAPADVRVRVLRDGRWVATPFLTALGAGEHTLEWDGTRAQGRLREGDYAAVLDVTDVTATVSVTLPFLADWTPPRVRLASVVPPRLWVSEPAVLRVVVNGLWRRLEVAAPGHVRLPWVTRIRTLLVVARDRAGNVGELRRP
jgi:hypothetical protein